MPVLEVAGTAVHYELLGSGPALALTPGGRFDMAIPGLRPLAERLAARYTVLLWDRPNTGSSDVCFAGPSESEMWADTLAGLLRQLGLSPAVVAGGSAGARTSLQLMVRHPEVAEAGAVWWISGGVYGTFSLGATYILPTLEAALRGGMAAVAALPHWAERIEANPRNRDLILGMDAGEMVAVMERWLGAYVPGVYVSDSQGSAAGMTDEQVARIRTPLVVVRGDRLDYNHPESVTRRVHELVPGSLQIEPPWEDGEWIRVTTAFAEGRGHLFERWPELAPLLLDALDQVAG